jgi:hypothetical protein
MHKQILERYRRDASGQLVIDIAAARVNDLYDDFDKQAPYIRKELDYDLVEYLIDSARELGREPFGINFSFDTEVGSDLQERVRKSISNYFDYLLARNARELRRVLRISFALITVGVAMLSASIFLNHRFDLNDTILERILAEGLVIASWVSMWEAIVGLALNWQPSVRDRVVFVRLRNARLTFNRLKPVAASGTE